MNNHVPIHEFRNNYNGMDRWAQIYKHDDSYAIMFFINQIYQNTIYIKNHSEQYAEDAAENFVLGVWNGLQQGSS